MLRRRLPSTSSLFTFEAVARLGSFSEAARELNVTQPAISRSIAALETHIGFPLFDRHGRWIELTYNGDILFRATSGAFSSLDDTLRQIEQRNESEEVVSISMSQVAINYWFIPRMDRFREKFPGVSLNFNEYTRDSDSFLREVDLNIRLSSPKDADMHRWPFADERIIALCSPQYLNENGALDGTNEGSPHSFVEWVHQRYGFDEFFHATGLQVLDKSVFAKFSDYTSVLHAVLQGHGIALAWVSECSNQIIEGNLVPACAQVVKTGRRYHILASNLTPMRPIVEEVRDWLIGEMRSDEKNLTAVLKERWNLF